MAEIEKKKLQKRFVLFKGNTENYIRATVPVEIIPASFQYYSLYP